ncbi:hypothetical protein B0H15DRAFT_789680, partial [Mycena belliarum]
ESEKVALTAHESRFAPLTGPYAPELWAASSAAQGFSYIRLGPEHGAFTVSMFPQLHCGRLLRAALGGRYDDAARGHVRHCLNYVRHLPSCNLTNLLHGMTLCSPDLILDRNFEVQRTGATHMCNDWEALYSGAASNWNEWYAIAKANATNHAPDNNGLSPLCGNYSPGPPGDAPLVMCLLNRPGDRTGEGSCGSCGSCLTSRNNLHYAFSGSTAPYFQILIFPAHLRPACLESVDERRRRLDLHPRSSSISDLRVISVQLHMILVLFSRLAFSSLALTT